MAYFVIYKGHGEDSEIRIDNQFSSFGDFVDNAKYEGSFINDCDFFVIGNFRFQLDFYKDQKPDAEISETKGIFNNRDEARKAGDAIFYEDGYSEDTSKRKWAWYHVHIIDEAGHYINDQQGNKIIVWAI